jgi:hypothetical protein
LGTFKVYLSCPEIALPLMATSATAAVHVKKDRIFVIPFLLFAWRVRFGGLLYRRRRPYWRRSVVIIDELPRLQILANKK